MAYKITGDTHGRNFPSTDCIILGDTGLNFYGIDDHRRQNMIKEINSTELFCIHGNHERRPEDVYGYELVNIDGLGECWVHPDEPNIKFAKIHGTYTLNGLSVYVLGGAYSVDKPWRTAGVDWWTSEQMTTDEMNEAYENIIKIKPDIILSHTAPISVEPRELFLSSLNQKDIDKTTEKFLEAVYNDYQPKKWYCGHYHGDKTDGIFRFMFNDIEEFGL